MRRGLARALLVSSVLCAVVGGAAFTAAVPAVARAEEGWVAEFEATCARTQDAMALSSEELRALIVRCDALSPGLAKLDESRRKVYAKRLQQCRDLYDFVLKSRQPG